MTGQHGSPGQKSPADDGLRHDSYGGVACTFIAAARDERREVTDGTDISEKISLPPDAGLVKSLGAHHTLNSAIADLVDNSVDAGAAKVSIRLLTADDRLDRVEVLDDGLGMDDTAATKAMTIGHQRDYVETDLGHFGMGLKAASFAHADTLTVWSQAEGSGPVGRRIRRADFSKDFTCEVLTPGAAADAARLRTDVLGSPRGTSIIWTGMRHAYRGRSAVDAAAWLETAENTLRAHLGTVFHRMLTSGALAIEILVDDVAAAEQGIPRPVQPIDPFGYAVPGHPGYPKELVAEVGGRKVTMTCHIWPGKTDITGFRIGRLTGERLQGFFIYRNDRLLQAGQWSDVAVPSVARQLARVVLDDSSAIDTLVTMNPEKHGLRFETGFHEAIARATADDGTTFEKFLADAEFVYTESRKRKRKRRPAIAPTKGFAPKLRKIIGAELPMIDGAHLELRWRKMPEDEFLDVDLHANTLWLNSRYRHFFAPERGSLNDAPVMKALLYLLTHHVFEGQYLGAKDKDEIALWKAVLGGAARAEAQMKSGQE